jgi:hypothetical protein
VPGFVYREDEKPVTVVGSLLRGEGPVKGFELKLLRVWKQHGEPQDDNMR